MSIGALAFVGIFALAAVCAAWNVLHRRGVEQRLRALGFEPCEADAPVLECTWRTLAQADDADHEIRVSRCLRRAAGWGLLHHFQVSERAPRAGGRRAARPRPLPGLPTRPPRARVRCTRARHSLPAAAGQPPRARLDREDDRTGRTRAEAGARATPGDGVAPRGLRPDARQARRRDARRRAAARAASHGFLSVHLGGGKAGFGILPNHRDVDAQLAYLAEWC